MLCGGGVLLGEEEKPLPNWPGRMMKYLDGSSGRPSPMKISIDFDVPDHMWGNRMALSLLSLNVP